MVMMDQTDVPNPIAAWMGLIWDGKFRAPYQLMGTGIAAQIKKETGLLVYPEGDPMCHIFPLFDHYLTLLEVNADLEAPQVEATLSGRIIDWLIWSKLDLRKAMGVDGAIQDISKEVGPEWFVCVGVGAGHILGYRSYRKRIGSLLTKLTSLQSSLIRPSSKISKILEEIFTHLEEYSNLVEALSSTFEFLVTMGPSVTYAVVVSAVVLLCFVYQYLLGYVDRGGSKADSSGALDFRDTYISIVLFQGSYIWIKSRAVSTRAVPEKAIKVLRVHSTNGIITKYEPHFKPHVENGVIFNSRIYLRRFSTRIEAEVVYRTAASCYKYGEDYGPQVHLGGGHFFTIPAMSEEEQRCSGMEGMEKVKMLKARALRVHKTFSRTHRAFIDSEAARNPPVASPAADLAQQLSPDSEGDQVSARNAELQLRGNQTQDFSLQEFEPPYEDSQVPHQRQPSEELMSQVSQLEGQVSQLKGQVLELQSQIKVLCWQLEGRVVSELQHPRKHNEEFMWQYSQPLKDVELPHQITPSTESLNPLASHLQESDLCGSGENLTTLPNSGGNNTSETVAIDCSDPIQSSDLEMSADELLNKFALLPIESSPWTPPC